MRIPRIAINGFGRIGRTITRIAKLRGHFDLVATELGKAPAGNLKQVAAEVIGHTDWQVEHQWAGIMGFVAGEHLGGSPRKCLDDKTEVVAGFGGMGVALTPLYAKQIAAEDWV